MQARVNGIRSPCERLVAREECVVTRFVEAPGFKAVPPRRDRRWDGSSVNECGRRCQGDSQYGLVGQVWANCVEQHMRCGLELRAIGVYAELGAAGEDAIEVVVERDDLSAKETHGLEETVASKQTHVSDEARVRGAAQLSVEPDKVMQGLR